MKSIFALSAVMVLFTLGSESVRGELKVGFSQVDITPPVGSVITGPGAPVSVGTEDPLRAKAMVVESGDRKLAIVSLDLVKIRHDLADAAIAQASQRTGIARDAVLICPTHNHSSPLIPAQGDKATINKDYSATLPQLIADSIEQANKALQPARMFLGRSLVFAGNHNRRVISKADGLALNTWLKKLNDLEQTPQVLGTEGPIDPEMWVARFDAPDGKVLGTLVNFSCHPNLRDRNRLKTWSADFHGVIAQQLAQEFGKQAVCVFTQGTSGNINPIERGTVPTPDWRQKAEAFAKPAVEAAKGAIAVKGPVVVDYARRDVEVPRCNPAAQSEGAIARLGWRPESFEGAKRTTAAMPPILKVPVSAARIGPLAIATNPGELFVEWGISIKKRSPFPHTFVSELTNEAIGYEPTEQAFEHEGYETLAGVNFVSFEGIQKMVDTAVELLQGLWKADRH